MEKERFLAFTDAIIAIIATIMVLEFKTPDKSGWPALAELTIPLLAYALSFFMIMTVWYNHHQLYHSFLSDQLPTHVSRYGCHHLHHAACPCLRNVK